MVGRGWWLAVWTVCAAWLVCVASGGFSCQPGQEYYNSQRGRCVPCTRCHEPQVVVVPCYVYRDAVCAPAAQVIPNWSQPSRTQAPITLSTTTTAHIRDDHAHDRQPPGIINENGDDSNNQKVPARQDEKSGANNSASKKNNGGKSHATPHAQDGSEKNSKEHPRHHHRHRHRDGHATGHAMQDNQSIKTEVVAKVNTVKIHKKSGANNNVGKPFSNSQNGVPSGESSDSEWASKNISDGAISDNTEESDLEQPETAKWKKKVFLAAIILLSISLFVLTIFTLSHLRNILARRKLKRVYDGVPEENNSGTRVMEQLLPSVSEGAAPTVASRGVVTYIRATTATSTPSSPTVTTSTARGGVESQRISGHVYPPIPFTMDRLLEQRRVLGPASSVDTNLYIESWQQQDSQPAGHMVLVTPGQCSLVRGSVSACPSPAPVRTYRPGPASASASPTASVRGLNTARGRVRPPVCVTSGGGGVCGGS